MKVKALERKSLRGQHEKERKQEKDALAFLVFAHFVYSFFFFTVFQLDIPFFQEKPSK